MEDVNKKIKMLRAKDIEKIIGCSKNMAYEIMKNKTFPSIQIGKNYYVTEENFYRWLNSNTYKKITL